MKPLELWGGAECTVNRVEDTFRDQILETGHHKRAGDFDLMADLGFSSVRFPVLWERISPTPSVVPDWSWSDRGLERLRARGVRPIVGLIHHGSGPRHTSLVSDNFAEGLAAHALSAAQRYPWVDDWTPVNEPLTTARFAALYGHWYPHARDERTFWLALLNQVDGVRLAMRAIRSVNPAARLVQTDDLGRTYATNGVADQAQFDNARRWASWDLLCGYLGPGHQLWQRIVDFGFEQRLRAILDDPCQPDVIGINHYLTSDRFLDHRVDRYPEWVRGGNGRVAYADVEAVRVLEPAPRGLRTAITDAWERYRLPVAVTEVHNGCTREEQLRWLREAWDTSQELRDQGVDVRAITVWALFGSSGWNTLLTTPGVYEAGAFDVSGGAPRLTAIGELAAALAKGGERHPAAAGPGWWRRDIRLHHPSVPRPAPIREHLPDAPGGDGPPILITGATGTLGRALSVACTQRDLRHVLTGRPGLDLADPASIAAALDRYRPWAVVNAAGWVRVDDAESQPEACLAANASGAAALARACGERGILTLSFSSDLVFGGGKNSPYLESDSTAPLNVYGRSKAMMEEAIGALPGSHLVIRTAAFFSPFDQHNFAIHLVNALRRGEQFAAAADQAISPTYVPDLCDAALDLLIDGAIGVWHLSNGETLAWADFAHRIAHACGERRAPIAAVSGAELGWRAPRPAACGLASERGMLMPTLDNAIHRFARNLAA